MLIFPVDSQINDGFMNMYEGPINMKFTKKNNMLNIITKPIWYLP